MIFLLCETISKNYKKIKNYFASEYRPRLQSLKLQVTSVFIKTILTK
jgi:hypothetical protein